MRWKAAMFVLAGLGLATPVLAQSGTEIPAPQSDTAKGALPIDRWISQPTSIGLTAEQRAKFDSLRSDYAKAYVAMKDPMKGDVSPASRSELDEKYKTKVRDILTVFQQPVFDKNFAAEYAMGGRKRPPERQER